MDPAIIEKEALLLPEAQRALLADRLIESISPVPPELREAWVREVEERMEAYRIGKISTVDGPQALRDLRSRFAK